MMRTPLWLFWVGLCVCLTQSLSGATILKLSKKKQVVLLDAGKKEGFKKGKIACFFDETQREILCGKVTKSSITRSYVHVDREDISKLKKGFFAYLQEEGDKKAHSWSVSGAYTPWIATPFSVVVPNYAAPAAGIAKVPSLWTADETLSSGYTSGGLEVLISAIHLRVGGSYLILPAVPLLQANYDSSTLTTFIERTFSGSAYEVYGGYDFWRSGNFSLGMGLDVNQSSVSIHVQAKNDAGTLNTNIFSITSSLLVFSLYVPIRYSISFSHSFSFLFGGNILVPFYASGAPIVTANDSVNGGKVANPVTDAQSALAHKKNSYGLALLIGLTYSR